MICRDRIDSSIPFFHCDYMGNNVSEKQGENSGDIRNKWYGTQNIGSKDGGSYALKKYHDISY